MRQPGGELPERGQPLGAPHRGFGLLQAAVGFRELLGGRLGFSRLRPVGLRQLVGEETEHREKDDAQFQLS